MVPATSRLFGAYFVQNEIRRRNKVCLDFLHLHIQWFTDIFISNTATAEIAVSTQQADKDAEMVEISIPEKGPSESHNVPLSVDKVKTTVWVVAVAGAAERFCYYALAAPLRKSSINLNVEATWDGELTSTKRITCRTQEVASCSRALLTSGSRQLQISQTYFC